MGVGSRPPRGSLPTPPPPLTPQFHKPKTISISSAILAQLTLVTNRHIQTDRDATVTTVYPGKLVSERQTTLDLNEARDDGVLGWQWYQLTICKQPAPRCREITTPTPHQSIFTGRILFLMPNQQCQSFVGIGTKLVHECKQLPFTERLKYLQPPTLKYEQQRRDDFNVKNYSRTI